MVCFPVLVFIGMVLISVIDQQLGQLYELMNTIKGMNGDGDGQGSGSQ